MAGQRELSILSGLIRGLNDRADNIRQLKEAKEKLEQKNKLFDLDYKSAQLNLERERLNPVHDAEIVREQTELLKSKQKSEKADLDFKAKTLDSIHSAAIQDIKNKKSELDIVAETYRRIEEGKIEQRRFDIKQGRLSIGRNRTLSISEKLKLQNQKSEIMEELKFAEGEERVALEQQLQELEQMEGGASTTQYARPGKQPQTGQFTEGQTAKNPKTGKKIIYKNGRWINL